MTADLKPCPFCGGRAQREDIPAEDGIENAGASYITCTRCWTSTALHFDRKENLESSWNERFAEPVPSQSTMPSSTDAYALRLQDGMKALYRAYVNLLEVGRDRILMLGGSCDPVDVMETNDPALSEARAVLADAPVSEQSIPSPTKREDRP